MKRLWIGGLLLLTIGCASLREGFSTRVGLTNPQPLMQPTPTDESLPKGSVGQQYIEEYDKKYHEKDVVPLQSPPVEEIEEREAGE